MKKITINLINGSRLVSYCSSSVEEAKLLLATKCVNGFRYVIAWPDTTGEIPGDEDRYAADCAACGVENYYA
jgi:hypothetical protein